MNGQKIITKTEKQTLNLGCNLAKNFCGGQIIALTGDLGRGKTILTKGIAKGLGIKKHITSPTFILMKIYKVKGHLSIKELCHIDCYRASSQEELIDIGIQDYLNNKEVLCVIEWADKLKFLKKYKIIEIKISLNKDFSRTIHIKK